MKRFLRKNLALAVICLSTAATIYSMDSDSDSEDRIHGHCHSNGYSIVFENPDYSVKRTYNKENVPIETRISSSKPFSCDTTREVLQIISWVIDRIEMHNIHGHRDSIHEQKPIEHIHRHEHHKGIIHELVNEVRSIGRDCIDAMPRPIGYFLGFWPIRPVLNCVFPHHCHKDL